MSRKRLSKTQLKRDKFVERTFDWAHWAETHRREMVGAAVALVVLAAGLLVYRNVSRGAEEEAGRDYLMARQAYFAGNFQLAVSDLQSYLGRHGGSDYADDAMLFLAESQLQAGQPADAVATLEKMLDEHGDSPLADNARRLLAAAYGQAGQLDRAAETYHEAIEKSEFDEQRVQLRAALAELYASQSRKAEAVEEYRAIVELQPEGPAAEEARRAIAELTVQPLTGDGSAEPLGERVADGSSPAESAAP